jgi:hypothetical protein
MPYPLQGLLYFALCCFVFFDFSAIAEQCDNIFSPLQLPTAVLPHYKQGATGQIDQHF